MFRFIVITNIGYLAAAIGSLWISPALFSGVLFLSLVLLAVGSAGFHYYKEENYFWQTMDVYGMYCTFSCLLGFLSFILWGYLYLFWGLAVLLSVGLCYFKEKLSSFTVVGALFLGSLMLKSFIVGPQTALGILLVFALSFLFRHLGEQNKSMHNLLHGLWHLGTTIGIFLFLFL